MSRPGFVEPQLATLVDEPVEGDEWVFERKLDGMRLIVVRDGDDVTLWTRNRLDRTSSFPELRDALASTAADQFVADAEVVAFDGSTTSFARLQRRIGVTDPDDARRSRVAVRLYVFDLLHLDGRDVSDRPLRDRKSQLRDALDFDDPIRFCPHRLAHGPDLLDDACRRGWEGLIAKRGDRPYRSGRSRDWLKLKCVARQELVIGGFTEPKRARDRIGALLLGVHDPSSGDLLYVGRVGTGFDRHERAGLRSLLDARERSTSPFGDFETADDDTHWARADLVCEVGFTEWTDDAKLRHPRYLGLREDKAAGDVVRERVETAP